MDRLNLIRFFCIGDLISTTFNTSFTFGKLPIPFSEPMVASFSVSIKEPFFEYKLKFKSFETLVAIVLNKLLIFLLPLLISSLLNVIVFILLPFTNSLIALEIELISFIGIFSNCLLLLIKTNFLVF